MRAGAPLLPPVSKLGALVSRQRPLVRGNSPHQDTRFWACLPAFGQPKQPQNRPKIAQSGHRKSPSNSNRPTGASIGQQWAASSPASCRQSQWAANSAVLSSVEIAQIKRHSIETVSIGFLWAARDLARDFARDFARDCLHFLPTFSSLDKQKCAQIAGRLSLSRALRGGSERSARFRFEWREFVRVLLQILLRTSFRIFRSRKKYRKFAKTFPKIFQKFGHLKSWKKVGKISKFALLEIRSSVRNLLELCSNFLSD